jgi:hypothetical protein
VATDVETDRFIRLGDNEMSRTRTQPQVEHSTITVESLPLGDYYGITDRLAELYSVAWDSAPDGYIARLCGPERVWIDYSAWAAIVDACEGSTGESAFPFHRFRFLISTDHPVNGIMSAWIEMRTVVPMRPLYYPVLASI